MPRLRASHSEIKSVPFMLLGMGVLELAMYPSYARSQGDLRPPRRCIYREYGTGHRSHSVPDARSKPFRKQAERPRFSADSPDLD